MQGVSPLILHAQGAARVWVKGLYGLGFIGVIIICNVLELLFSGFKILPVLSGCVWAWG